MKEKAKRTEDFWDDLDVRKRDDDREFQRKVVLGADAIIRTICKGILRGIVIAILILIVLYAHQQYWPSGHWGLHDWRIVPDHHDENGNWVPDRQGR